MLLSSGSPGVCQRFLFLPRTLAHECSALKRSWGGRPFLRRAGGESRSGGASRCFSSSSSFQPGDRASPLPPLTVFGLPLWKLSLGEAFKFITVNKHWSALPPSMHFWRRELAEPLAGDLLLSVICCNSRSLASHVAPGEPRLASAGAGSARSRPTRARASALAAASAVTEPGAAWGHSPESQPVLAGSLASRWTVDCGTGVRLETYGRQLPSEMGKRVFWGYVVFSSANVSPYPW